MLEALGLAKVPDDIIKSVERLTDIWATQIQLKSNTGSITTDVIRYLCGVIQGDTLSVLLFILSLNPLSFLLTDAPGYKLKHENQSISINHLLFVDDLKLIATTLNNLKLLLDIVITFSKDIGMKFGLN